MISFIEQIANLSDVDEKFQRAERRKAKTLSIARSFRTTGNYKRADKLSSCCQFKFLNIWEDESGKPAYTCENSTTCKDRFCQDCQHRKSMHYAQTFLQSLPLIHDEFPDYEWLFLTLTVRNPGVEDTRSTIQWMNLAWARLTKRKAFPAIGYIKSLEVTKQKCVNCTHPHFHVLMLVPKSYFYSKNRLSTQQWRELWQQALQVDYLPQVKVNGVKSKSADTEQAFNKAALECMKYSMKEADINPSTDFLKVLAEQLHQMKTIAVAGVVAKFFSESHIRTTKEQVSITIYPQESIRVVYAYNEYRGKWKQLKSA